MSPNPKNRIKPKLLREQKTEALLVFIRTTLEQTFKDIENKYSNRVFLVDKDINDENRVKVFLNSFNQFLNLNFKKLNNSESVNDVKC